ncbi:MAG: hypothetical protein E7159_02955 [Firmicutes bacterium]|jgi:hypothetical protein|nr:hypothetical protein [Bacillota bacterium]
MNREDTNMPSIIVFVTIIAILLGGGFYLITHKDIYLKDKEEVKVEEKKSIKILEDSDYIYYSNLETIDEHNSLEYKTININIDSVDAKELQETLNNNMSAIRDSLIRDAEGNVVSCDMISYDYNVTSKYISLNVTTFSYLQNEEQLTKSIVNHYVFDIETGKILNTRDILKKENLTDQEIRVKIREYIKDDTEVDIDATLNSEYSLSIIKDEKVVINTVVKNANMDYNVSIEMD